MYSEEDLLPLSALQHLVFCQRQCALIHIEGLWADNRLTVQGTQLHARVDADARRAESRGQLRVCRRLALRSLELGLSGRSDVVEFHRVDKSGVKLADGQGLWRPYPVEYKRGRPKQDLSDQVQLCAQALCLEEMLAVAVPRGALFYSKRQKRSEIRFDSQLREETRSCAGRLHSLISSGRTPRAVREPKCRNCSLLELCLPQSMSNQRSARRYLEAEVRRTETD